MANITMSDYFEGKVTIEEVQQAFLDDIYLSIEEHMKTHKGYEPHFEISIAWDDDDEFEHEGYYNSVDDAINALLKYKEN